MLNTAAEHSYNQGLSALSHGRLKQAMALFEAAIEIERRVSRAQPQARYLSFYGLCLAMERNEVRSALQFCREAVTNESYNPDVRCNLGRVLLYANRRREAYRCLLRGLQLDGGHVSTVRMLRNMGTRRSPVVPFLERTNPINVFLGRMRATS